LGVEPENLLSRSGIPVLVQLAAPPLPTETETTAYVDGLPMAVMKCSQ
jgi:hypothetical protein